MYNMDNIKKHIARFIWDFTEFFNIPLGKKDKYAPIVFGWMIGSKGVKIEDEKHNSNGFNKS